MLCPQPSCTRGNSALYLPPAAAPMSVQCALMLVQCALMPVQCGPIPNVHKHRRARHWVPFGMRMCGGAECTDKPIPAGCLQAKPEVSGWWSPCRRVRGHRGRLSPEGGEGGRRRRAGVAPQRPFPAACSFLRGKQAGCVMKHSAKSLTMSCRSRWPLSRHKTAANDMLRNLNVAHV